MRGKRRCRPQGVGILPSKWHARPMSDMPEEAPPSGMGEIGVCAVAPAIANAMFQLTGKRLRHLPMSAKRVKTEIA